MFFQKVLKGINGISYEEAENIVCHKGITCNWWRQKHEINNHEVMEELVLENLIHHLEDYDVPLPRGHRWSRLGKTYGDVSAFISTTAGTIYRDDDQGTNIRFDPFITALNFATKNFTADGYLFYAYVTTLGKQSVPLQAFAEEVRELNIYTGYLTYLHEGEITAKISIPSVTIEKAEFYTAKDIMDAAALNLKPKPAHIILNPGYAAPDRFNNIRELL
jgi:hypothetical protein